MSCRLRQILSGEGNVAMAHQEERIDCDVEGERREDAARIVVVPYADLGRDDDGRVHEQDRARDQHAYVRHDNQC